MKVRFPGGLTIRTQGAFGHGVALGVGRWHAYFHRVPCVNGWKLFTGDQGKGTPCLVLTSPWFFASIVRSYAW